MSAHSHLSGAPREKSVAGRPALLALGASVTACFVLALLWISSEQEPAPVLPADARVEGVAVADAGAPEMRSRGERLAAAMDPVLAEDPVGAGGRIWRDDLLAGRVVDAISGEPVEAFRVAVRPAGERGRAADAGPAPPRGVFLHDPDGRFRFDGLAEGTYTLLVDPAESGYEKAVIHDVRLPLAQLLVARVVRGAHVEGRVLDAAGTPVADFEVVLEDAVTGGPSTERGTRRTTDGTGRFLFTRVTPGTYRLSTVGPKRNETGTFAVPESARVERDVTLQVASSLSITVQDSAGASLEGASVLIASRAGFRTASADSDGTVRIGGLGWDRYALEISRPGFLAHYRDVDLQGSGTRVLDVVLESSAR